MVHIRQFEAADYGAVRDIYQQGIDTQNATFQQTAKGWEEWDASMLPGCRLVAVDEGQVLGWAALAPVSDRCVYGGVAEVSIYIATTARGRGLGHVLLPALISASEEEGLWTLQAGIFPENEASIALHKKHGFRVVGVREKLGEMNGRWRDVVLLERRSARVGV